MSAKKELSRAELVRLRREQEHAEHMHRIAKEAARSVQVTTRTKKKVTTPKAKTAKPRQNPRRRFQIALPALPAMPRAQVRPVSFARPRFGWRLLSFILSAIFGAALYLAFNLPQLRVTEA